MGMYKFGKNKKYLSYSAISTWLQSPATYRKRYYESSPMVFTPELMFGKKIADLLENKDESVAHIKQYVKPEQKINCEIEGVPIFGFIDSFDPETNSFYEFKTGRVAWTQRRVDKHLQLDIYSLCIENIFGSVNDECELIWLETEKKEEKTTGLITHEESHRIALTGVVKEFKRTITDEDRLACRDMIVRIAGEISDDYTKYLASK